MQGQGLLCAIGKPGIVPGHLDDVVDDDDDDDDSNCNSERGRTHPSHP